MVVKQKNYTFQCIDKKNLLFAFHALHSSKREKTFKILNELVPVTMKRR
jgi:hypothetical protein